MAKVEYADAIKTVSGALTKINKKSPHAADQKMVLATHRVAPTTNPDCSRLYLRGLSAVTRTTPVKPNEVQNRSKFANIASMVADRAADLSYITQDQIDFLAQKDQPGGKKTMRSYLWKICKQAYESGNSGN